MPDKRIGHPTQSVPQWKGQRVNATASTPTPIGGNPVNTTIAGALTAGSNVVMTPASMQNIKPGKRLKIVNGTTWENVAVISTTASTFTVATLVNSYGTNSNLYSVDGSVIGGILVGSPGTTVTLAIYNGLPGMLPQAGAILENITISSATVGFIPLGAIHDLGAYYTLTGTTAGDYTIFYLDMPQEV